MASNKINFRALQIANEQRSAYGLRYNDFSRYRKHCANRCHRLRSSLKATHGKGREYKKLPPVSTENLKDGHLALLLFEAERAWSYSQDLSAQLLLPANADNARKLRHTATGRFRRAVHWAMQLLSHCQSLYAASRLGASELLEATAYTLILNGRFLRSRDEFEDAIVQLSVARYILDVLASAASTSRDQALATVFSDEIGPEIRYCAHELGSAKAYDIDGIVQNFAEKHRSSIVEGCDELVAKVREQAAAGAQAEDRKTLGTLLWEEEPVPIRNPELVDVLLRVQQAQSKLRSDQSGAEKGKGSNKAVSGKRGVAAYDAILSALSDAEEVARKLAEAQRTSNSTAAAPVSGTRDLQFVYAFITFQLLSRRIERDLVLVSALLTSQPSHNTKQQSTKKGTSSGQKQKTAVDARLYPAVVKLLESTLQSLEQMRTLSIVDESPDLAVAVEVRVAYTKARRCLYLAQSYDAVKKYAECLALHRLASIHLREARSSLETLSVDPIAEPPASQSSFYPLEKSALDDLESSLDAEATRSKIAWFTYNGGKAEGDNTEHKKPLFFDIALNYVQLDMDRLYQRAGKDPASKPEVKQSAPSQEKKAAPKAKAEETRESTPEPEQARGGGLSSLLGGWWGRK